MVKTGWHFTGQSDEDRARQLFVAVTGMQAFKPSDEIEAMLAAQAMAAHHASMECSRRAMIPDQPFEAPRASARRLPMRPVCSPSCYRRWTASAARAANRWSVSSMFTSIREDRLSRQCADRRRGGSEEARTASCDRPGAGRHHAGRPHLQAAGTGREEGV